MNRAKCEQEELTSMAIQSGTVSPETTEHAQHCPACSDILLISEFLRNHGTLTYHEARVVPDAGLIWRKAQWRATQHAGRLAARPIRWMTILACIAFACSPWLRLVLPVAQDLGSSWSRALDSNLFAMSRIWPATSNEPIIVLAISGTMILLGLSSWLMLREE
jgi:hypothetical protein